MRAFEGTRTPIVQIRSLVPFPIGPRTRGVFKRNRTSIMGFGNPNSIR